MPINVKLPETIEISILRLLIIKILYIIMNRHLYHKNIFLKKTKDKYNPDVLNKKNDMIKIREATVFKKSSETYNSITNKTPINIKSQKDLELEKDQVIQNMDSIIMQKKKEREDQESLLKPQKQKILAEENLSTYKAEDFNEHKTDQIEFVNDQKKIIETKKHKFDDIILDLKSLGILN